MANSTKKKQQKLTSPKGRAKYPWLNQPDTRFNPDGEYRVSLLLPADSKEAQAFMEKLDELADEAVEKAKNDLIEDGKKAQANKVTRNDPYVMEEDKETGEETGNVEFKFKMKAKVYSKKHDKTFEFTPDVFDAKGNPVPGDVRIFGGSILRVSFVPDPYYMPSSKAAGISLKLKAVQVIELSAGGRSASDYGFYEEDGFDVKDDEATKTEAEGQNEDTSTQEEDEDDEDIDF